MNSELIMFLVLAIVAVASGLGVLLSKSAIYAALNLIINFTAIAIFYLLLGAPFIALTQIAVYAGAIMVLFLFVVMLLGADRLGGGAALPWQRPLAIVLGVLLIVEAAYMLLGKLGIGKGAGSPPAGYGAPAAIGAQLFSTYLLPFEVISVLLLAAMVGAIVLTKQRAQKTK